MAKRQFVWLLDSASPRKGPRLIKGEKHNVSDYPSHVVDYWVQTGSAEYVEDSPKKSNKQGE